MKARVWRRLLRRHYKPIYWRERKIHEQIAADLAADPAMCEPDIDLTPMARPTRVIDQGMTLVGWDDWARTWTMETARQDVTSMATVPVTAK